jgi:DNA-binding NtrC family response regulator
MSKRRRYKVLVVDDEAAVLYTYRLLLEDQGYETTAVLSSREAKDALEKHSFDILLCDLSLEENHTGFEVIEFARKLDPDVPCVLLTGYANVDATDKAQQDSIPVLYKPIEIQEFLATIPAILRNKHEQAKANSR